MLSELPSLVRTQINIGKYPITTSQISSVFRNVFLMSNSIRKDSNLDILCYQQFSSGKTCLHVKITGEKLRYLSPDERNTLFLIQKIMGVINKTSNAKIYQDEIVKFHNDKWAKSTPGIRFIRTNLIEFITPFKDKNILVLNSENLYEYLKTNEKPYPKINPLELNKAELDGSEIFLILDFNNSFLDNLFNLCDDLKIRSGFLGDDKIESMFFPWEVILILYAIHSELGTDDTEKILN